MSDNPTRWIEWCKAAIEVLREVEYGNEWDDGYRTCPVCGQGDGLGHEPDCRLASVIRGFDA